MPTMEEQFAQAQKDVNELSDRPDNETLLKLYACFKQATHGDATGEPPGGFNFVKRAKFDAWSSMKGVSKRDAMQQYVALVKKLAKQ